MNEFNIRIIKRFEKILLDSNANLIEEYMNLWGSQIHYDFLFFLIERECYKEIKLLLNQAFNIRDWDIKCEIYYTLIYTCYYSSHFQTILIFLPHMDLNGIDTLGVYNFMKMYYKEAGFDWVLRSMCVICPKLLDKALLDFC